MHANYEDDSSSVLRETLYVSNIEKDKSGVIPRYSCREKTFRLNSSLHEETAWEKISRHMRKVIGRIFCVTIPISYYIALEKEKKKSSE